MGAGAVGENLSVLHLLTELHHGALILARALVESNELTQHILISIVDDDALAVDIGHGSTTNGGHDHAGEVAHGAFHTRGNARWIDLDQRHCLTLHVRTHERAVCVVVLEERNERRRNADDLLRTDVDVLDLTRGNFRQIAVNTREHGAFKGLAVALQHIRSREHTLEFLIGAQEFDLSRNLAVLDLAIRRLKEAVVVDLGIDSQRRDQTDVGAFRRFDRTDAAVVRNVNVAHFEARALAVESTRPKRRESTLMHQHGQRVSLVDNLREFTATKEEFNRARNRLGVDQIRDLGEIARLAGGHALLHRATELEEALAHFFGGQFIEGAKTTITQVVDVIDMRLVALGAQVEHVTDDRKEVLRTDVLHRFRRRLTKLAIDTVFLVVFKLTVDPETTDAPEAVAVVVEELLLEERLCLVDLRRIARTKSSVDLEQRRFMLGHAREEVELLFGECVEDERITRVGDDANGLQVRRLNRRNHVADGRADAAELFARIRVNHQFSGVVLRLELRDLDFFDFIEQFEQTIGRRILLVERAQERGRRELRRLVDSHRHDVLLRDFEFDPRTALRDDARLMQRAIANGTHDREVDARRTVELADDAALRTIHDELAAAHHDRNLAEVDFLVSDFARAFANQSNADAKWPTIGQAQFAALVRGIAGLVEFVVEILKPHGAVVALDGKDFPQELLKPAGGGPFKVILLELQEALVRIRLHASKDRNGEGITALREIPNRFGRHLRVP